MGNNLTAADQKSLQQERVWVPHSAKRAHFDSNISPSLENTGKEDEDAKIPFPCLFFLCVFREAQGFVGSWCTLPRGRKCLGTLASPGETLLLFPPPFQPVLLWTIHGSAPALFQEIKVWLQKQISQRVATMEGNFWTGNNSLPDTPWLWHN